MKKYRILQLCVASSLFFAGCSEDEIVNPNNDNIIPVKGSEVLFGTRAGFEDTDPSTRTEYSGQTYKDASGAIFERINWVKDDKVQIYCEQSVSSAKTVDYVVAAGLTDDATDQEYVYINADGEVICDESGTPVTELPTGVSGTKLYTKDYTYLNKINTNPGIQWGSETTDHTFYALYPSPEQLPVQTNEDGTTVDKGVAMDLTTVKGIVPRMQTPVGFENNDGNIVVKPNMNYAYMVAKTTTKPVTAVPLTFYPLVSAVDIEFVAPTSDYSTLNLVGVGISYNAADGETAPALSGNFTCDLAGWDGGRGDYPTCTVDASTASPDVYIPTLNGTAATEIVAGKTMKVTAFLLPTANLNKLTVTLYTETGNTYKTLTRKATTSTADNDVNVVVKHKKTSITDFTLPTIKIDNSKWMSQLPDDMKMNKLSLPGTGGSFSYLSTDATYRSQLTTMDFEAQWNAGIRAFEVVTGADNTDFANELVICNGNSVSETMTVKHVVEDLVMPKVTNSEETVMLIFTYQFFGEVNDRASGTFMTRLNTYFNNLMANNADKFIQFSPSLTLGDAKGKIMIVVRPTQVGLDSNIAPSVSGTAANKILVVNGCGSAPDKWGKRGYYTNYHVGDDNNVNYKTWLLYTFNDPKVEGFELADDIGNQPFQGYYERNWYDAAVEEHMDTESDFETYVLEPGEIGNNPSGQSITAAADFSYTTNNSEITCWYQDWSRVVSETKSYKYYWTSRTITGSASTVNESSWWWKESKTEKRSNAIETLDKALNDTSGNLVYINSLCGFYVQDETSSSSYRSATPLSVDGASANNAGGDIQGLATYMNSEFYNYISQQGALEGTGPTGVVLMDYVGDTDASTKLPTLIITNNFKFTYK